MKTITIKGESYTLEYTFNAAMEQDVVQMEFEILTGASIAKEAEASGGHELAGLINATGKSLAQIPTFVSKAFYAGLLEHHEDISKAESDALLKAYMKQKKISFVKVNELIQECMQDDDFFEYSGLMEMIENLTESIEENVEKVEEVVETPKPKTTQTAKKTQTKSKPSENK